MQLINKNVTSQLEFTKLFELAVDSSIKTSEDCLFLNIHAPIDEDYMIKKKPVLFVIHGGDGTTGTGSLDIQEPSVFASMTNTIVVTFNYRLGIFGFLNINGEEGKLKWNKKFYLQSLNNLLKILPAIRAFLINIWHSNGSAKMRMASVAIKKRLQ